MDKVVFSFSFSDGWLLTTLWAAKGPVNRERLNATGDVFNHAIFTDHEVEKGMKQLARIRFAEPTDGQTFAIAEAGAAFVKSHWNAEKGHIDNMFIVCRALQNL